MKESSRFYLHSATLGRHNSPVSSKRVSTHRNVGVM